MSVVPSKKTEKIQWYKDRIAQWTSVATSIGTTSGAVTALGTKITAAEDAYNAKQLAEAAAKAATTAYYNAVNDMGVDGQAIIKQVRAKAESSGDMDVYSQAMIPPPRRRRRRVLRGRRVM